MEGITPDPVGVRRPDKLVVNGPVTWTFTKAGLTSAVLNGREVLSGGFGPVNSDHLFDPADGADKVKSLLSATNTIRNKSSCFIEQRYSWADVQQIWVVDGEDATCDLSLKNWGPDPIRYPSFGGLVAHWPTTPVGLHTGAVSEGYLQLPAVRRNGLTPGTHSGLRLRCSYLADSTVGVAILPLDVGNERNLILWEARGDEAYTSRGWRVIYDREIPPGESRTFRLAVRVSANVDWRHLLEGWKGVGK